jgi:transmembrane sensor
MNRPSPHPHSREEIAAAAAQWVLRRDRGLTAAEQDEFSLWLAADPRHGAALAEHSWGWNELDRLTGLQTSLGAVPDPDLFAPPAKVRARRWWRVAGASSLMAAAAVVALMIFSGERGRERSDAKPIEVTAEVAALAAPCERRTLEDGSVVELNRGAAVEVAFSAAERRVTLVRGEANFAVAKDAGSAIRRDGGRCGRAGRGHGFQRAPRWCGGGGCGGRGPRADRPAERSDPT